MLHPYESNPMVGLGLGLVIGAMTFLGVTVGILLGLWIG